MIRAVVTDIEGTTSSIRFVKDVLFPYAREHLPAFIEAHGDSPEVGRWLEATAREAGQASASRKELVAILQGWIDSDRKATPLKALQGMIWKEGYASGAYRAHMYPEVAACLRRWRAAGLALYVYSSGSVAAQKLFFSHSEVGDLTPLFSGYFDTETGPKREAGSYRRIADQLGLTPSEILFLSDTSEELDAAHSIGMVVTQLCRPPSRCAPDASHPCVADFDSIHPDQQ